MFSQTIIDSKHIILYIKTFHHFTLEKQLCITVPVFLSDNTLIYFIPDMLFMLFVSDLTRFIKGEKNSILKKQDFIEILSNRSTPSSHLTCNIDFLSCPISAHL